MPIWCRFARQWVDVADARARLMAGRRIATRITMIAITNRSAIRLNAVFGFPGAFMLVHCVERTVDRVTPSNRNPWVFKLCEHFLRSCAEGTTHKQIAWSVPLSDVPKKDFSKT